MQLVSGIFYFLMQCIRFFCAFYLICLICNSCIVNLTLSKKNSVKIEKVSFRKKSEISILDVLCFSIG